MCGIHGIFALGDNFIPSESALQRMGDITHHRGPDDEGKFVSEKILLGMRRLAIIDLTGGHQPIANEDETLWVVCNGEIYNFRELRAGLIKQGHLFRTGSDTEVIVHLYEEYNDDFVLHLDGMFGFALWDVRRRRLLIGRDRLGIKPLYYYQDHEKLIFASEAKSILAVPGVKAEIDPASLTEYLTFGYVPGPRSLLRGIRKLPPASMLICEKGRCDVSPYWRLSFEDNEGLSEEDWADALRTRLEAAVRSQMVSDVPLGAFLSGGIDSSGVVAMMARHSDQPVKTFSIGFEGTSGAEFYNELPYARRVADLFGTEHKEIIVKPDVAALLPKLLWHMDEPLADAAFITTYLVAKFAREEVTVILSGVGGDELFGGYRRYLGEYYGQYYQRLPAVLRQRVLRPLAHRLPSDRHSPLLNLSRYARAFMLASDLPFDQRYRAFTQVFSADQCRELLLSKPTEGDQDALNKAFAAADQGDYLQLLSSVDLALQLPDDLLMLTDKMTMATSLECRVPLLDQQLVELCTHMPSRYKIKGRRLKYILKKALNGLLPDDILERKKRGFGAPMGAWLKAELSPLLKTVLSKESVQRRGLLCWETVQQTIALHEANREDHTDHLLSLMNFELWCQMYLDGGSPDDLAAEIGCHVRRGLAH
ncbi:MAG: asparagine synthase (glutamine-hydrolyzing) [Gammaproteobacteria bacterium]